MLFMSILIGVDMALNIKVVMHKAEEGGFWVEVPALPGCFSQGETKREALESVKEAISMHLESLGTYLPAKSIKKNDEILTVCVSG